MFFKHYEYGNVHTIKILFTGTSTQWGKIAEKAIYRSVFLTTLHCILSAELTKILPTGNKIYCILS